MANQKTETALVKKVKDIANVMASAGVGFTDYITQLFYILFLKMDAEKEEQWVLVQALRCVFHPQSPWDHACPRDGRTVPRSALTAYGLGAPHSFFGVLCQRDHAGAGPHQGAGLYDHVPYCSHHHRFFNRRLAD